MQKAKIKTASVPYVGNTNTLNLKTKKQSNLPKVSKKNQFTFV